MGQSSIPAIPSEPCHRVGHRSHLSNSGHCESGSPRSCTSGRPSWKSALLRRTYLSWAGIQLSTQVYASSYLLDVAWLYAWSRLELRLQILDSLSDYLSAPSTSVLSRTHPTRSNSISANMPIYFSASLHPASSRAIVRSRSTWLSTLQGPAALNLERLVFCL